MKRPPAKFFLLFFLLTHLAFAADSTIRYPFVSGEFYPSNSKELSRIIDGFLSKVPRQPKIQGQIKILILPHAGYVYSGQTAAYGYQLIEGADYDTVILIGPYHRAFFHGVSIWKSGLWKTPLGEVPVDSDLAGILFKENAGFQFTQNAHSAEHSLEVQLPFLQKVLKKFKIVPLLINDPSPENIKLLAESIYKNIQGKKVLIIASSDMSHYYPEATAREMDYRTLELLKGQDSLGLAHAMDARTGELCGQAAVMTALEISRLMRNTTLHVLNYTTTADSTGDRTEVVGYGASVIFKEDQVEPATSQPEELSQTWSGSEEQKKILLRLARQTVETYVTTGSVYPLNPNDLLLKEKRAAFVTIRKHTRLRGCIGNLNSLEPLGFAVRDMAIQAASQDPRFGPVQKEELKDLNYEISVLSFPVRVKNADEIQLGKHGVIVRQGNRSGVFLPKVAEELGTNKEGFLKELCVQKAGLPENCWQDPQTDLYVFTADEFGEAVVK